MNFNEIQTGDFFTIGETPSYPKLKTNYGYIDFRDEIKKQAAQVSINWPFRIMELDEVHQQLERFNMSKEDIVSEKERLLNQ